jgi:transposase
VLFHRMGKTEYQDGWLMKLRARRNANVAAVALANKNARVVWALLAHQREYRVATAMAVA